MLSIYFQAKFPQLLQELNANPASLNKHTSSLTSLYYYISYIIYKYIYIIYREGELMSDEVFVMKEIFGTKYIYHDQNIVIGNLLILTIVISFWLEFPFAVKLPLSCL